MYPISGSDIDISGGTGNFRVTMPSAHPNGVNYTVICTPTNGGVAVITSTIQSSTQFTILIYNLSGTPSNCQYNCVAI